MATRQRVLVVVDPTASHHPAIERAAWLARSVPCLIELFICDNGPHLADARDSKAAAIAEGRAVLLARHTARLEQLAGPLAAAGLKVTVDSRWDYPLHDGIVRKALDFGADLVVKDTHFHSALKRSIFSNTDWSLIRNCASQLWLVKPRLPGRRPCF